MAQVFKNYTQASIGTSPTTVYTVAGGTTAIVIGLNLANRTAGTITASAQIGSVYIIKDAPIPAGSTLEVMGGNKVVLQASDVLKIDCDVAAKIDATLSIMEIT